MAAGAGHIGVVLLLVPADPVRGRRADEDFAAEAAAAGDAGHDLALTGHDAPAEPGGPDGRAVPAAWSRRTPGTLGEVPPGTGPASFTGAVLVP